MGIPKTHEIFSLTNKLTSVTDCWYSNAINPDLDDTSFGVQFQGRFLSRVVNLLIIATELIDLIENVAMGVLTLLILAPGEAIFNLGKDATDKSNLFTVKGGFTNFGYAFKHLIEAIPRAVIGVCHPGMASYMFQTKAQLAMQQFNDEEEEVFLL